MSDTVGAFGAASDETRVREANPRLHLKNDRRFPVYLAIAGLMEAGLAISEAAEIVANEYGAIPKTETISKAIISFFGNLEGKSGDEIAKLANRSFGMTFLEPEERAVLRALASDGVDQAKVLRAAAEIVQNSMLIGARSI